MKKYAVVIERGPNHLSAYVPDLPGCISTGRTVEEIQRNIARLSSSTWRVLLKTGSPVPEPRTLALEVEVRSAA